MRDRVRGLCFYFTRWKRVSARRTAINKSLFCLNLYASLNARHGTCSTHAARRVPGFDLDGVPVFFLDLDFF